MIRDSSASLLAYGLDDPSLPPSKVAVVDIGWSSTEISIYDVSGGLFFPLASVVSTDICGKIFVDLLADHCAKDFQRKSKLPCTESSKSMMRLKRECEDAMKILSTGVCSSVGELSTFVFILLSMSNIQVFICL
jgi:heat shock 70kDa protein 1/2/6/8